MSALRDFVPWLFGLSVAMFIGSLILLPILIIRLPADYFSREGGRTFDGRHPVLRICLLIVKNAIGYALIASGVIMLFTPGQGILAIVVGVSLVDFPGKRALELSVLRRPSVIAALNKIRTMAGRNPLQLPERSDSGTAGGASQET